MPAKKKIEQPAPEVKERGATGTLLIGGRFSKEEFNLELRDSKAIETFDKMRRTDAQVNATLLAIELPILSAIWQIDAASDDLTDQEIKDFVELNLFKNKNFTWSFILRHILKYLQFGHYVFEKVWEQRDGKFFIKKLAPRKPVTIQEWIRWSDPGDAKYGTLKEIKQFAYTPKNTYETLIIPNEYLLLFTNDQEGDNYVGKSILRTVYRNWLAKDKLIKIDAIKHERQGLGVPLITLPQGATKEDQDAAEDVCETFRAHEKGYVILPDGWKFEVADMKASNTSNVMESIRWHNSEITGNILGQFLDLGKTETGSRAVAGELKDIFLLSIMSVAKYVEDIFNEGSESRQMIRELVDLNFSGVTEYPKLRVSKIKSIDYQIVSAALASLAQGGLIMPDQNLEEWIREAFELPKKEETQTPQPKPINVKTKPEGKPNERLAELSETTPPKTADTKTTGQAEVVYWRPLTELENKIQLKDIDSEIRKRRDELLKIGLRYRMGMIKVLVEKGTQLLAKKESFKDFGDALDEFCRRDMPMIGKMENEISIELKSLWMYSKNKIKQEIAEQGIKMSSPLIDDPDEGFKAIRKIADLSVSTLEDKLYSVWKKEMIRQKIVGHIDTRKLSDILVVLSTNDFKSEVYARASEIFGLARDSEAAQHQKEIEKIIRSEVMDENTCDECAQVDGMEFDFDSPEYDLFAGGGYIDCAGTSDRCRGMNIYEIGKPGGGE